MTPGHSAAWGITGLIDPAVYYAYLCDCGMTRYAAYQKIRHAINSSQHIDTITRMASLQITAPTIEKYSAEWRLAGFPPPWEKEDL